MREPINLNEELQYQRLNANIQGLQTCVYDRLIYEISNRVIAQVAGSGGFYGDGFVPGYIDATHMSIGAGHGFYYNGSYSAPEPQTRMFVETDTPASLSLTAADGANDRIDVVSLATSGSMTVDEQDSRNFENETTGVITSETLYIQRDWNYNIVVTLGTPAGSPVAPATPAGRLKLAEVYMHAATGLTGAGDVTDFRTLLPIIGEREGFEFDYVVGDLPGCDIRTANFDAFLTAGAYGAGKTFLIVSSFISPSQIQMDQDDTTVIFKNGVTMTRSAPSVNGFVISGDRCNIIGGRFDGFTSRAIDIAAGAANCRVVDSRFINCAENVRHNNSTSVSIGLHDEA